MGEISKALYLDAGTLTPLLKKLESAGYLTRRRSTADERITLISLTKKGDSLKEICKDIPSKVAPVLASFSEKDLKELYRLLYMFMEDR